MPMLKLVKKIFFYPELATLTLLQTKECFEFELAHCTDLKSEKEDLFQNYAEKNYFCEIGFI